MRSEDEGNVRSDRHSKDDNNTGRDGSKVDMQMWILKNVFTAVQD